MFTARVSQMDYRNQLKAVGKKDYRLDENDDSLKGKPQWAQPKTKPSQPTSEVVSEAED